MQWFSTEGNYSAMRNPDILLCVLGEGEVMLTRFPPPRAMPQKKDILLGGQHKLQELHSFLFLFTLDHRIELWDE